MDIKVFSQLNKEGILTDTQLESIQSGEINRPVSLAWELKTLMYCGVLSLSTGLGILIYKNLDSIGHLAIVISIAVAMLLCFAWCYKKTAPFTFQKSSSDNLLQDYILLLGCMLMFIFLGYLHMQYNVFGNRWGMATFIPMIILFIAAYYFDHLGVLSMAVINLAAWAGITVTPMHLLKNNNFSNERIILTGIFLGLLLIVLSLASKIKDIKKHFAFTYKNFGVHLLFICIIAGMIHFESIYLLFFLLLAAIGYYQFTEAYKEKSLYFIVVAALYSYIGLSYVLMYILFHSSFTEGALYIAFFYFIFSAIGFISILMKFNKMLKHS